MTLKHYLFAIMLFSLNFVGHAMPFRVETFEHGYADDCSNPKIFTSFVELDKGIYLISFNLPKNSDTVIFFDEYQDLGNHWHLLRNNKVGMVYRLTGSGLLLGKVIIETATVMDINKLPEAEQAKYKTEYCMFWTKGSDIWKKTWDNFLKTHSIGKRLSANSAATKEKTCNMYNNAKSSCAAASNIDRCIDIKMGWDNNRQFTYATRSYVRDMCK